MLAFQAGVAGSIPATRTKYNTMSAKSASQFLYTVPQTPGDMSEAATTAIQMGALASQLASIERTRVSHKDGRAENDAEHSLMLAKVAPELAHMLYPELDANLVARFAALHDDVEAYVGDTPTDMLSNLDQAGKDALEQAGLQQLLKDYAYLPSYTTLIKQYEAQSVPEARFVRAVDKLMVLVIHVPNAGAVLRAHYTQEAFQQYEQDLLERDSYKYGEFDRIKDLRRELGKYLATTYLDSGLK